MAKILVVDDEASVRDILVRRLTQWGHEVVAAHGPEAALTEMEKAPAQIVFSDVIMPVHDGLWLAKEIRSGGPRPSSSRSAARRTCRPSSRCVSMARSTM